MWGWETRGWDKVSEAKSGVAGKKWILLWDDLPIYPQTPCLLIIALLSCICAEDSSSADLSAPRLIPTALPSDQMIEQTLREKAPEGSPDIKETSENEHVEDSAKTQDLNLIYEGDEEPELHLQTYFALAAMFFLNLVQVFALMGPPAGVSWPVAAARG